MDFNHPTLLNIFDISPSELFHLIENFLRSVVQTFKQFLLFLQTIKLHETIWRVNICDFSSLLLTFFARPEEKILKKRYWLASVRQKTDSCTQLCYFMAHFLYRFTLMLCRSRCGNYVRLRSWSKAKSLNYSMSKSQRHVKPMLWFLGWGLRVKGKHEVFLSRWDNTKFEEAFKCFEEFKVFLERILMFAWIFKKI